MLNKLKRVVIKEELVALTGDFRSAVILNQFIYWTERMKDIDKYIKEETDRASKELMEVNINTTDGWIYKTAEQLNEELMLGRSVATIRKYIKQLVERGLISQRRNPVYKWDNTLQYRVDLYKVQLELAKLGYALEGYKMLTNITIAEKPIEDTKEASNDNVINLHNKKAPVVPPTEAKKVSITNLPNNNTNISQDDSNGNTNDKKVFVPKFNLNPKIHKGLPTNFLNYGNEKELEQMLLDSQKSKFSKEKIPSSDINIFLNQKNKE